MKNRMSGTIPATVPTTDPAAAAIVRRWSRVAMRKLTTVMGVMVEQLSSDHDLLDIVTFEARRS